MSGASTEPCRGRRIPGRARCLQGQRTLSVGSTAFGWETRATAGYSLYRQEPQQWVLGQAAEAGGGGWRTSLLKQLVSQQSKVAREIGGASDSSSSSEWCTFQLFCRDRYPQRMLPTLLQVQFLEVVDMPVVVQQQVAAVAVC